MAIPTELEFKSYADTVKPSSLAKQMDSIGHIDAYDKAVIKQFIDAVITARSRFSNLAFDSPVGAWIEKQPTAGRAYAALHGKRKSIGASEDYADALISHAARVRTVSEYREWSMYRELSEAELLEKVERWNEKEAIERRMRDSLNRFKNFNPWKEELGIAQSFSDYFYTDRYKTLATEGQSSKAEAIKIKEAISTLRAAMEERSILPQLSSLRIPKSFEADLDSVIQAHPECLPIRRLDNTARERCLAFDLWRTFISATGKGKPRAIWYFMEFEGVKNQADMRELERRSKRWKAAARGS